MKEVRMKTRYFGISILMAMFIILTFALPSALAGKKSQDIQNFFDGGIAFSQIEALCDLGPRVAGSSAEKAAADYIAAEMESYGLDVEIQEFDIIYFEELSDPVLEQVSPNHTVYFQYDDFLTMTYSGSGDVTASVQPTVDIMIPPGPNAHDSTSGCEEADFFGFTPGNIALIQRGSCSFFQKAQNAQIAGAVGAIIFNEGQEGRTDVISGTIGGPGVMIPVVGTSFDLGKELYDLIPINVEVRMNVDVITEERTSQNVIGTLEGLQPEQGIVYIGGHYDSVSAGPGANDDASGVAGVLEAARVLSSRGHRTKATMKFLAFGSKEIGLDGSYWYVNENYDEVTTLGLGMINLDMIAVGDIITIGNVGLAADELVYYTKDKADAMGLDWDPFDAGANSDHYYFEVVGCPVSFLHHVEDPYYHTSEDTPDKIQVDTLEENGELATAVLYDWAMNPALREKKAAKEPKKAHVYKDKVLNAK
jgi:Zn-dependent M28 family amino/carboxypeptidase